jgi:hypothetical protein
MGGMIRKSLDSPEETRPFHDGTGELQLVNLSLRPHAEGGRPRSSIASRLPVSPSVPGCRSLESRSSALPPHVIHDARHGPRVTSDTPAPLLPAAVASTRAAPRAHRPARGSSS